MADSEILTRVEFRSDRFPPYQGEQVNPDLWGKRLAEFLCEKLPAAGFKTEGPRPEDWGWYIDVVNSGFRLWIGCGHYQEYPDGYLCFIEPNAPYIRKFFRKIDTRERVNALQRALDKILVESNGIREKRRWTYEDFNSPDGATGEKNSRL